MKNILFALTAIAVSGCATAFTGSAHVSKAYCQKYCQNNGLHFNGMVAMGEYSSGCICTTSRNPASDSAEAAGAGSAAVGVVTQMRSRTNAAHHR